MTAIDPNLPVWPRSLAPRDVEPQMDAPMMFGPHPGIGAPRCVQNQAGLWRLSLIDIPLAGDDILTYRAIIARAVATGGALYMPMWEWIRSAVGDVNGQQLVGVAATGPAYRAAAAALSYVSVTPPAGATVSTGRIIGIGERAHIIWDIENDETAKKLYVWPPIRDAVAINDPVEFYNPVVRMRLDIGQAKQSLGALTRARYGSPTIDLVEDNW